MIQLGVLVDWQVRSHEDVHEGEAKRSPLARQPGGLLSDAKNLPGGHRLD